MQNCSFFNSMSHSYIASLYGATPFLSEITCTHYRWSRQAQELCDTAGTCRRSWWQVRHGIVLAGILCATPQTWELLSQAFCAQDLASVCSVCCEGAHPKRFFHELCDHLPPDVWNVLRVRDRGHTEGHLLHQQFGRGWFLPHHHVQACMPHYTLGGSLLYCRVGCASVLL